MGIIIIAGIHFSIMYILGRLVKSDLWMTVLLWTNTFIAIFLGNPIFSGIDITAVWFGGCLGAAHRKK